MRIWSKKLITSGVLPTKQLKAMRYELGDMIKQYPNIKHGLVKFANNYDIGVLFSYYNCVIEEFDKRNIRHNKVYDNGIVTIVLQNTNWEKWEIKDSLLGTRFDEDNEEYLKICYWNLYEKHLRKMITDEEWQKIDEYYTREIMGYGN